MRCLGVAVELCVQCSCHRVLLYKKTVINTVRSFVWRATLSRASQFHPFWSPLLETRAEQLLEKSSVAMDFSFVKNRQSYVCPGWCNEMPVRVTRRLASPPHLGLRPLLKGRPAAFNSCSYTLYTVVFGPNWGSLPLLVSCSFTSPSSLKATILWLCHFSSSMGWLQNCL